MWCLFYLLIPILGIIAGRTAARRGYLAAEGYVPTLVLFMGLAILLELPLAYIEPHTPHWCDYVMPALVMLMAVLLFDLWLKLLRRLPIVERGRGVVARTYVNVFAALCTLAAFIGVFIFQLAFFAMVQREQRNTYQRYYYANPSHFESSSDFPFPESAHILYVQYSISGFDYDDQIILAASPEHVDALRQLTPWKDAEWKQGPFTEAERHTRPLASIIYLNGQELDRDSDSLWVLGEARAEAPEPWRIGRVLLLDTEKGLIWFHAWKW